jgi:hypothetical protein
LATATDSSQAGYLAPLGTAPPYDTSLEDIFQAHCAGLTGLDGKWIRPRWQPNPPNQPPINQDWVALGVTLLKADWDSYQTHDPNGNGQNVVSRSEVLQVNYSFYGPNCNGLAAMLRDGMSVTQNRDALTAVNIKFTEWLEPVTLPVLLKDVWNRRIDIKGIFTRRVTRRYAILNLVAASGTLDNEQYTTPLSVPNP